MDKNAEHWTRRTSGLRRARGETAVWGRDAQVPNLSNNMQKPVTKPRKGTCKHTAKWTRASLVVTLPSTNTQRVPNGKVQALFEALATQQWTKRSQTLRFCPGREGQSNVGQRYEDQAGDVTETREEKGILYCRPGGQRPRRQLSWEVNGKLFEKPGQECAGQGRKVRGGNKANPPEGQNDQ